MTVRARGACREAKTERRAGRVVRRRSARGAGREGYESSEVFAGSALLASFPPPPAASLRWIASKTSRRWTGTSFGASTPRRTLSPRISTTTIVMSSLMTILSFFFLESTNILSSFALLPGRRPAGPCFETGANGARRKYLYLNIRSQMGCVKETWARKAKSPLGFPGLWHRIRSIGAALRIRTGRRRPILGRWKSKSCLWEKSYTFRSGVRGSGLPTCDSCPRPSVAPRSS